MEPRKLRLIEIGVGFLYLLSTATAILHFAIIGNPLGADNLLQSFYESRTNIAWGIFSNFVNCFSIVGISILLYSYLKTISLTVALSVVVSRVLEAILLMSGGLALFTMTGISEHFINSKSINNEGYTAMLKAFQSWNEDAFDVGMMSLGIGGFLLALLLYKKQLVPRWISVLGVVGYPVLLVKSVLSLLEHPISEAFFLPVGLFELFFPIWLLIKGFRSSR